MAVSSYIRVSSKYQIVLPADIRKRLRIKPGDTLRAFLVEGTIRLVRLTPLEECRGMLKGLSTEFIREDGDRY